MATQWHPLFVSLLRPVVESRFSVETEVPVGDKPRSADLVLLRKTGVGEPFHGMWQFLTEWNLLEYKGPTESARIAHLDLLVELGLGVDRRLQQGRRKRGQRPLPPSEVTFWYLARKLNPRFLRRAGIRLHVLEAIYPGMWRCTLMERTVILVSGVDVPTDEESLPLKAAASPTLAPSKELLDLVLPHREWWSAYRPWFLTTVSAEALRQEVMNMARTKVPKPNMQTLVDFYGLSTVLESIEEAVGVEKVVDTVGVEKVVDTVGVEKMVDAVERGVLIDELLRRMSPKERKELQKRLGP